MPRVGGGTGTATNWRQVNAIIGSGFDAMGWVPEGQRSGQMSYSTSSKSATFVTIGEEDAATFEAISAGREFEDIQARMTFRLLQKMMLKEEMAILAGNASLHLGHAGDADPVGFGHRRDAAGRDVLSSKSSALTLEGYQNSSVAAGVATTKTVTGVDGKTFTLNGGSSSISGEASQAVTLGQASVLQRHADPGRGRICLVRLDLDRHRDPAGDHDDQQPRSLGAARHWQPVAVGDRPTDNSANPSYAYDGLLTTALKIGSNAYVNTLPTGTAGTGTPLTASGRGSVNEIDTMFQTMWNNFELSPTVLYVNAQELKNITTKVLSNASGPLLRYDTPADGSDGEYQLTASGVVQFYYNPFAIYGGLRIPIKIHPRVPPGTIIGWAENLPIQYQSNEVPNVAELKTRQDYYQIDWPIVTRQRQVGVYAEEVLAVYAPFAMGVITNIANG